MQVLFRADVVVIVDVGREELVLASRAPSHGRDLVVVLQDDEAAFHGRTIRLKQTPVGSLPHPPLPVKAAWFANVGSVRGVPVCAESVRTKDRREKMQPRLRLAITLTGR